MKTRISPKSCQNSAFCSRGFRRLSKRTEPAVLMISKPIEIQISSKSIAFRIGTNQTHSKFKLGSLILFDWPLGQAISLSLLSSFKSKELDVNSMIVFSCE